MSCRLEGRSCLVLCGFGFALWGGCSLETSAYGAGGPGDTGVQADVGVPGVGGQGGSGTVDAGRPSAVDAGRPSAVDAGDGATGEDSAVGVVEPSDVSIDAVFLAQTHVSKVDDPLLTIVAGRPALLKVHVLGSGAAPRVIARLVVGGEVKALVLNGPGLLPTELPSEPGEVQHRYEDSFSAEIPAKWVQPGLSVQVRAGEQESPTYEVAVAAPSVIRLTMFDAYFFGRGSGDYPTGWLEELESKWPVAGVQLQRVEKVRFPELVIPATYDEQQAAVRVSSVAEYEQETGRSFDGEQAAAIAWVKALREAGGQKHLSIFYTNIYGVPASGEGGGLWGVGAAGELDTLNHTLGHALSLKHWGEEDKYPYKGDMFGISAPTNYQNGTHAGPTWAFDLRTRAFIPPTVQAGNVGGFPVGTFKSEPMIASGPGDQEPGYLLRHFSDYSVDKMRKHLEKSLVIYDEARGAYVKWDDASGSYNKAVNPDPVKYPVERSVQVFSLMAAASQADRDVSLVYPPIGPYTSGLIRHFDPRDAADREAAKALFCPGRGCDYTLRVKQAGQISYYMLPASVGSLDPKESDSLSTVAVNVRAADGAIEKASLLYTPDAESQGIPEDNDVITKWEVD